MTTTTPTDPRPARCRTCAHCKKDPDWPWVSYSWGSGYLCHREAARNIVHVVYAYSAKEHWPDMTACPDYAEKATR